MSQKGGKTLNQEWYSKCNKLSSLGIKQSQGLTGPSEQGLVHLVGYQPQF